MTDVTLDSWIIEPDIDAYGSKARASALADYLEVCAMRDVRLTRAALQEIIKDNEWVKRPIRQFHSPEPDDDPESWVDSVFQIIAEREARLQSEYPFEEHGRSLRLKSPSQGVTTSRYIALLAITVVHAWKLATAIQIDSLFERVVVECLRNKGLDAIGIGAAERGLGFVDAINQAGQHLGLMPMADPRPRSRSAKDGGVDTIAGVVWRDFRPAGQWLMIGQVTVAQSQEWKIKFKQPEPPRWAGWLQENLLPVVFLAIPHHAEPEHIRDMTFGHQGLLLDRLRLTSVKPANTPEELELIRILTIAEIPI